MYQCINYLLCTDATFTLYSVQLFLIFKSSVLVFCCICYKYIFNITSVLVTPILRQPATWQQTHNRIHRSIFWFMEEFIRYSYQIKIMFMLETLNLEWKVWTQLTNNIFVIFAHFQLRNSFTRLFLKTKWWNFVHLFVEYIYKDLCR